MRRVAVTGIGVVSPLGNDRHTLFRNLIAGRSGIRHIDAAFCKRLMAPIAAPAEFDAGHYFPAPRVRMLDRVSQFALHATSQAIADAGLLFAGEDRQRAGVFIGTGLGGARATDDGYQTIYGEGVDRVNPFSVLMAMTNAAAAWIGIEHDIRGPNLTFSTACSSSAVAIGEAWRRIGSGDADLMIAGGSEAPLTFGVLKAWEALGTLASEDAHDPSASCKPFSRDRSGLVLGEGAAILVLEEWERATRRGAHVHAELTGYGLATDAMHITRPTAEGQAAAMRAALDSAGLPSSAIDYLNAHGTGTLANDGVETAAIKSVFQGHAYRMPVSSTKSMHGHLLGAAGALEFAVSVLALKAGTAPPTINLHNADPECDLDYVPLRARHGLTLRTVMSNSFAFGGTNAVLVARAS